MKLVTERIVPTLKNSVRGVCQVALYSFTYENDAGELTRYLLPLLDLVNHRGAANTHVVRHAPSHTFRLEALADIRCGASADPMPRL